MSGRLPGVSLVVGRDSIGPDPGGIEEALEEAAMSDRTIRRNVIDELDFDPSIDAAGIGVAVEDAIVTLSGHVARARHSRGRRPAHRRLNPFV